MLIDTHCHLDIISEKVANSTQDRSDTQIANKIVQDAYNAGIVAMITVGTTLATSTQLVTTYLHLPGVFGTIGMHPCDVTDAWQQDMVAVEKLLEHEQQKKIIGIGECGLDFYHPGFIVKQQQELFRAEIELALRKNLPLIIHTRNAFDATLSAVDEYKKNSPTGIFHCFSEDIAAAHKVIDRGFLIGIGGAVTYPKNDMLRNVVRSVGLEHIALETDAPFLPPQKFRGTVNTPEHVATIAQFLAEFLGCPYEEVGEKTTINAQRLFKTDFV